MLFIAWAAIKASCFTTGNALDSITLSASYVSLKERHPPKLPLSHEEPMPTGAGTLTAGAGGFFRAG